MTPHTSCLNKGRDDDDDDDDDDDEMIWLVITIHDHENNNNSGSISCTLQTLIGTLIWKARIVDTVPHYIDLHNHT